MTPSPKTRYQDLVREFIVAIQTCARSGSGGKVLAARCDVFLTETNLVQPDVLYVSAERTYGDARLLSVEKADRLSTLLLPQLDLGVADLFMGWRGHLGEKYRSDACRRSQQAEESAGIGVFLRYPKTCYPANVRPTLQRIAALALLWIIFPGTMEAAENLGHLLTSNHLAHSAESGDSHSDPGPEHGCNTVFHLCACHTALSFLLSTPTQMSMDDHADPFLNERAKNVSPAHLQNIEHPPRS